VEDLIITALAVVSVLLLGVSVIAMLVVRKQKRHLDAQNINQRDQIAQLEDTVKKVKESNEELVFMQRNTILNQKSELDALTLVHTQLKNKTQVVESQKKSSEVKLGLMAENFMPFIRDYPYDHKKFRFLANPVDGIQVTDDSVIFIEFKTGAARLSKSQRVIKDMVAKGNVRFETFRVNEQGTSLKIESSMGNLDEPKTGE
jgi:predicted Holliday junction resolvase-like endonuclease